MLHNISYDWNKVFSLSETKHNNKHVCYSGIPWWFSSWQCPPPFHTHAQHHTSPMGSSSSDFPLSLHLLNPMFYSLNPPRRIKHNCTCDHFSFVKHLTLVVQRDAWHRATALRLRTDVFLVW